MTVKSDSRSLSDQNPVNHISPFSTKCLEDENLISNMMIVVNGKKNRDVSDWAGM
jgi:hypothetical protein